MDLIYPLRSARKLHSAWPQVGFIPQPGWARYEPDVCGALASTRNRVFLDLA